MLKPGGYERYIDKMLKNPKLKDAFEEYHKITGRYPPFYLDNPTEEELLIEVTRIIQLAKNEKSKN